VRNRTNTKGIGPGRLALPEGEAKAALPTAWRKHAACNTGDAKAALRLFFDAEPETAKRRCSTCIVRPTCLAYALLNDERYGVWGGTDQEERYGLHSKRASSVAKAVQGALPELAVLVIRRARADR
jgi:WhiB family transcriptional regulator, redox-sensing transcriptional regulator